MNSSVKEKWLNNSVIVRWNLIFLWSIFGTIMLLFLPYLLLFIIGLTVGGTTDSRAFLALVSSDSFNLWYTVFYHIVYIGWNVLFFIWLTRICINNKNLTPERSVKWAVFSWFIPIVQLYMPLRVMTRLFGALNHVIDPDNFDLKHKSSVIVKQWWIICLSSWTLLLSIMITASFVSKSFYFWLSAAYLLKLLIDFLFVLAKIRMINYYHQLEQQVISRKNQVMLVRDDDLIDR